MSKSKPLQKQQVINWAAKMDDRTNSEVANITPDQNGISMFYLENADLYYSKALRNRNGVQDLCGGVVNTTFTTYESIVGLGTGGGGTFYNLLQDFSDVATTNIGSVIIPSGNFNIFSGSCRVGGFSPSTTIQPVGTNLGPFNLKMYIYKLDQSNLPASGISFMSGNSTIHNIGLSGNYNVPPYPLLDPTQPTNQSSTPSFNPIAVSNTVNEFTLSAFGQFLPGYPYVSNLAVIPFKFEAPVLLQSGSVYFIQPNFEIVSGTVIQSGQQMMLGGANEVSAGPFNPQNTMLGLVSGSSILQPPSGMTNAGVFFALPIASGNNNRLLFNTISYSGATFFLKEFPTANKDLSAPLISGLTYTSGGTEVANEHMILQAPFNGATTFPTVNTESVEFGQVIRIPNITKTIYGGYFYATTNERPGWSNYTALKSPISGTDYDLGYVTNLSKIDTFSGTIAGGDYTILTKTLVASASGIYTFSGTNTDDLENIDRTTIGTQQPPNYGLNKIYSIFANPVNTNGTDYLLSFKFYDAITNLPYTDYSYKNGLVPIANVPMTQFQSFIQTGFENSIANPSGIYVTNRNNDGITFSPPSGSNAYFPNPTNNNLTCGLISSPSGNAVVGIYDYRVGSDRASKIVYGQAGEVRYFDLDTPNKSTHVVIQSGISTQNNALMSFVTYDDLLFMSDYSQVSGTCWDQTNTGTMIHGLRPTANISGVAGTGGTIPSGVAFNVLLGTNMSSGGIRTRDYPFASGISVNNGFLMISGLANQFAFDVPPVNTSIYITAASGANYYIANCYSGASTALPLLANPLASGTDVVYVSRLAIEATDNSFSFLTDYPTNYAVSQTETPKLKFMRVYFDYILGIGDPLHSSRLWYSEQYAPQIWGESFDFHGYIEVDKDNGSPLTGMCPLRDYMILAKKNAIYRMEFLGTSSQPFSISQINGKIGSLGAFGMITVGDTVYGLCEYGIFGTNGTTVSILSDMIDPFFETLDHGDLTFASAIHDMQSDKIIWSISNDNASRSKDIGIMFNYKEGSFSVRKGSMWNSCNVMHDDDGFDVLLGGTTMGQIQIIDGPTASDNETLFSDGNGLTASNPIVLVAETPWLSVMDSQVKKQFRFLDFNAEKSDTLLKIDVYFDEDDVNKQYTRYINLNTNNPDKRVNLGGKAKTIKIIISNAGGPAFVKIKSMNVWYVPLGIFTEI